MNCTNSLIAALITCGVLSLNACTGEETQPQESVTPILHSSSEPEVSNDFDLIAEKENKEKERVEKTSPEVKTSDPTQLITDLGFTEVQADDLPESQTVEPETFSCLKMPEQNKDKKEQTLQDECLRISNRLASVSMESCLAAKLEETGCQSVLGYPIMIRNFAPVKGKAPQARVLIIGGTHADELTSVSTTFKWIEKLNKHHSGLFHWHVIPLMNPDGLFKKSATRTNHNGVDLNRNMPSNDWHANALDYWHTKTAKNPRRYPGEEPSSEPETQWLVDEINAFKPDAIISLHAPYGIVDFDSLTLRSAPKSLGKLHLNLLGTYPGSLGNYAGINRNIPVITLELAHAWVMPSESEITKIWQDIVAWLKENVNKPSE